MIPSLNGLNIAILVTDGFEQVELTEPKKALEAEGAMTKIISDKRGTVRGVHHGAPGDEFQVDGTFDEVDVHAFDAVLLPGGEENSARIRNYPKAQQFVRDVDEQGKSIAVICHGAWLLVSAGLVEGRTLTSWPTLQDEIRGAGANWIDQEVVVDGNWVSSRKPDDLPAFDRKIVDVMGERMRANLQGKADGHAVGIAGS